MKRWHLIPLLAIALSGCASLPPIPPPQEADVKAFNDLNSRFTYKMSGHYYYLPESGEGDCKHWSLALSKEIGGKIWILGSYHFRLPNGKQARHAIVVKDGWAYDIRHTEIYQWNPNDYAYADDSMHNLIHWLASDGHGNPRYAPMEMNEDD